MKTGVYIHFPYCEKKCPYCDFNSHVVQNIPQTEMTNALIADFDQYFFHLAEKPNVVSIFFGGGTPSLMLPSSVEKIISHICQKVGQNIQNLEITLEANPSSFEANKFRDFKSAGVNRISIGVQSFIESDLKALGRLHDSSSAKNAILQARDIFEKFSFDLIYARQGQKIEDWKTELTYALQEFQPSHISLYSLTIEKGTEFFRLHKNGKLTVPTNQEEFYDTTNEITSNFGLQRYEISNYAKSGHECLHNMIYWQSGQYLGIGAGAHGRINTTQGRIATMNFNSPQKYLNAMQTKGNAIQTYEILDSKTIAMEVISTGLRTTVGFALNNTITPFVDITKVNILQNEGLLTNTNGRIIPSKTGISLCDGIAKFIFSQ